MKIKETKVVYKCGHMRTIIYARWATKTEVNALARSCKDKLCDKCEDIEKRLLAATLTDVGN